MMELKIYLAKEWKHNNHNKYRKYFEAWYENLTPIQIEQYTKFMNGEMCTVFLDSH